MYKLSTVITPTTLPVFNHTRRRASKCSWAGSTSGAGQSRPGRELLNPTQTTQYAVQVSWACQRTVACRDHQRLASAQVDANGSKSIKKSFRKPMPMARCGILHHKVTAEKDAVYSKRAHATCSKWLVGMLVLNRSATGYTTIRGTDFSCYSWSLLETWNAKNQVSTQLLMNFQQEGTIQLIRQWFYNRPHLYTVIV